jgi:hypothetical protein
VPPASNSSVAYSVRGGCFLSAAPMSSLSNATVMAKRGEELSPIRSCRVKIKR